MKTIYLDSLFALNFIIDYVILLAAGKICALPLRRGRMALAAALGGAYAVLAVVLPEAFAPAAVKVLAGLALPLAAFGAGDARGLLRAAIAFFAVSAAFAGAVYALSGLGGAPLGSGVYVPVSLRLLVVCFALCYAAVSLVFRYVGRARRAGVHEVEVSFGGKSASLRALDDTGNELTDPISGEAVMVAWVGALAGLFSPEIVEKLRLDPLTGFGELSEREPFRGALRLVPYSSVGGASVLLCLRPDAVRIDGRPARTLVGLSRSRLSPDGKYEAII